MSFLDEGDIIDYEAMGPSLLYDILGIRFQINVTNQSTCEMVLIENMFVCGRCSCQLNADEALTHICIV